MLHVGDTEKLPQALGLESLDLFLRVSKQGPCLTTIDEYRGDKRLVQLVLACELMVLPRHILFNLATAVIVEAILIRISVKRVPFLDRVHLDHFKVITSSNSYPFMVISKLMSFVPLVMILLFSVLNSTVCTLAPPTNLLVRL